MKNGNVKEKLLRAGSESFLSKSYTAARVDEICKAAGVSKGSFFHYFKSKEDLAIAVLENYFNNASAKFAGGDYLKETDPIERAYGFIDFADAAAMEFWGNGCLFGNFVTDLRVSGTEIEKRVENIFRNLSKSFAIVMRPIAALDKSGNGPTALELSEQFLMAVEGAIVLGRAYNEPEKVREGIRAFRRYLDLIVKNN